jgi:hypothetical protein
MDGEPTTGLRLSPDAIQLKIVIALQEVRLVMERLERASWALVARELVVQGGQIVAAQLASPVWPGRVELRVGPVLTLVAGVVFLFGADRGWLFVTWITDRIPSVQIGSSAESP